MSGLFSDFFSRGALFLVGVPTVLREEDYLTVWKNIFVVVGKFSFVSKRGSINIPFSD